MRRLIALTGKTCSGKSTAATYLVQKYGFEYASCIIPLRTLAASIWGRKREAQMVQVMIDVGAVIRAHDPALLMRPLIALVTGRSDTSFVVDDLRMKHEVPILKDLGFRIFRITCPDYIRRQRMFARDGYWPSDEALTAQTETDLDEYEFEVIDGSLPREEFCAEVARRVGLE